MNFNGTHYKVYYPADGDEESLSEYELDTLDIVDRNDRQYSSGSDEEAGQSTVAAAAAAAADDDDDKSSIESVQPQFPIGTRFIKVHMN
jgi:hypothetical protein